METSTLSLVVLDKLLYWVLKQDYTPCEWVDPHSQATRRFHEWLHI